MSSEVEICNLALSHIGDEAEIADLNEASAQAKNCSQFYPQCRDELVAMRDWTFARRTEKLVLRADAALDGWEFAYAMPNDALVVRRVFPEGFNDPYCDFPFSIETDADGDPIIYSNSENAFAAFSKRVTDAGRFPPLFVTALSFLLAARIAGPIIKGAVGMRVSEAMLQSFYRAMEIAQQNNLNQQRAAHLPRPSWIEARGGRGYKNV